MRLVPQYSREELADAKQVGGIAASSPAHVKVVGHRGGERVDGRADRAHGGRENSGDNQAGETDR